MWVVEEGAQQAQGIWRLGLWHWEFLAGGWGPGAAVVCYSHEACGLLLCERDSSTATAFSNVSSIHSFGLWLFRAERDGYDQSEGDDSWRAGAQAGTMDSTGIVTQSLAWPKELAKPSHDYLEILGRKDPEFPTWGLAIKYLMAKQF